MEWDISIRLLKVDVRIKVKYFCELIFLNEMFISIFILDENKLKLYGMDDFTQGFSRIQFNKLFRKKHKKLARDGHFFLIHKEKFFLLLAPALCVILA